MNPKDFAKALPQGYRGLEFLQRNQLSKGFLQKKDAELDHLKRRVDALESQNDSLEQYTRRNSLRLAGLEGADGEDIMEWTMDNKMKVLPSITPDDIDRVHRFGRKDQGKPSLPKNSTDLVICLRLTEVRFSVIALTETRLSPSNSDLYQLPNYNSFHATRTDRRGGGVALYVQDFVDFRRRTDLEAFTDDIESLFIEIPSSLCDFVSNGVIDIVCNVLDYLFIYATC
ncbi:hypothetical protein CAPTEDRAFT_216622 [Capitella teleta]|uniref:Uncharacterized protein n=1 Tax=Capitella teleta TaxID=283909 RepID=R7TPI1_CAPTE|nr:hypothetical protein CAPTEDRAFT_216622 [Capitella teleta]|eukprot:ELT93416.1 hypothetical protein CAPTEDRAFT_216622 [Capitella teleta]